MSLVHTDPEILGGLPVFVGSRMPIETVLASLEHGCSFDQLVRDYPFLTPSHIDAAREYAAANHHRAKVAPLGEQTGWKLVRSRVIR